MLRKSLRCFCIHFMYIQIEKLFLDNLFSIYFHFSIWYFLFFDFIFLKRLIWILCLAILKNNFITTFDYYLLLYLIWLHHTDEMNSLFIWFPLWSLPNQNRLSSLSFERPKRLSFQVDVANPSSFEMANHCWWWCAVGQLIMIGVF